jgi:hypothetical protein
VLTGHFNAGNMFGGVSLNQRQEGATLVSACPALRLVLTPHAGA